MEFHPNDLSDLDDLTEEHLGFSALSDGLGFSRGKEKSPHPAATKGMMRELEEFDLDEEDRPVRQSEHQTNHRAFTGTGAVAAGPARPAPAMTRPTTPTKNQATSILGPTPAAASQVLAEPAAPRWLRASAFLLDAALILLPLSLGWFVSFGSDATEIFLQDPKPPIALFTVIFSAYFLLSESFGGQSLAKMLLGLRVVEDDKYQKPTGFSHAVARLGLFLLGVACLGLGFFASFWDAKRRPWHDRYSGSIVRRRT